jgi:cytochrome c oxidase subunit 1/cytochrome c oxidase subunit I+III
MALLDRSITEEALETTWEDAPGVVGFLTSVDHKRIGVRYIYTAFIFFFLAGLQALVMRVQLAAPDQHVLGPQAYNELFTMHGASMIFLFNTPVLAGFGNYLLPLQLGTRDMAFPRLNAFSYWVFVLAGTFMYTGEFIGRAPDGGWFAYVPLTGKEFSPGLNLDFWGLGVLFVGISTTVGAINFIVTIFKMRAPGMSLNRMPVFCWSILVMGFMVLFAVPALTVATALLEADRIFGTAFYDPARGGDPLLYQHLFWFWGHPEVYILLVPALGMISSIVPTFARAALAGYTWVVTSLVGIGFVSFGLWVHHMFATGIPAQAMGFFSAASMTIAIPSGILIFAWIATLWRGTVRWSTALLFVMGFASIFVLGGITGVMVASLPFDLQAHDSYFVVAHFHYVLVGGVVFPIFGALYFWLPKMTGRLLSERLGTWSFWSMFVGFHTGFFPQHILGLLGMPRRIYTYDKGLGWDLLNLISTVGGFLFGVGVLLSLVNWWRSRSGTPAGNNPWYAEGLEWTTTSPPPHYNFAVVAPGAPAGDLEGALDRATPVTADLDAVPERAMEVPEETYVPFVAAVGLAVILVGLLVEKVLIGGLGIAVALAGIGVWTWRTSEDAS